MDFDRFMRFANSYAKSNGLDILRRNRIFLKLSSSTYFKLVVILITSLIIWTLRDFLLLIICSLVVSNIVCNLCNLVQKVVKIPRPLILFFVLIVISLIIFSIFFLVLPPFVKEFNEILVDIPNALTKVNILINTNLNKLNTYFMVKNQKML